jgi:hypothetical protein
MHPTVFVKLKKTLKTLSSGQKIPKKTQKNPKKTQKNKKLKTKKKPTGLFFFKKPRFFPTLSHSNNIVQHCSRSVSFFGHPDP